MRFATTLPLSDDPFALAFMALVGGFILGAIPFGFIISRFRGVDIRRHGSGNIGFTNVARVLGWSYALPVLVLDLTKGFLPVFVIGRMAPSLADTPGQLAVMHGLFGLHFELLQVIAGLGAILGHLFTPVLKFKGGKGVATTAGVMLALAPRAFGACLAVFLIVLLVSRYLSAASMTAAVALPVATALLLPRVWPVFGFTLLIAAILLVRHATNVKRLLTGTEPRFTLRPKHNVQHQTPNTRP